MNRWNNPLSINPMDVLLQHELNRMLDRLAAGASEGVAATLAERDPQLRALIDQIEGRLAALRESMLDSYRQWGQALEVCEDLWALSALKAGQGQDLSDRRAA